jgi:hypothetical protein
MSLATALTLQSSPALRAPRKMNRSMMICGLGLTLAAITPFAIAAFGIARGGIEPYMVLAALVLG